MIDAASAPYKGCIPGNSGSMWFIEGLFKTSESFAIWQPVVADQIRSAIKPGIVCCNIFEIVEGKAFWSIPVSRCICYTL